MVELPALLFDPKRLKIEDAFHRFVRPLWEPETMDILLKDRFSTYTIKDWNKNAVDVPTAMRQLEDWLTEKGIDLKARNSVAFVICGNSLIKVHE